MKKIRTAAPLGMLSLLTVIEVLSGRLTQLREEDPERGDVSITTVIIWVAAIALALLIAGTIAVLATKYNGKLAGQ
ncbi:hypothetical protein [Kitasatospora kifunensis]|uniref:Uncharacterized protein n=1 Tax=Kitasatospora kifunensis TaxID=58351 RepID=A0A7W7RD19_KITKI|nr:hypothetical protein [Kitasatospora kifunensis]MBB4929141.1 hypothetical protein [Kitasatospora kifunensis]